VVTGAALGAGCAAGGEVSVVTGPAAPTVVVAVVLAGPTATVEVGPSEAGGGDVVAVVAGAVAEGGVVVEVGWVDVGGTVVGGIVVGGIVVGGPVVTVLHRIDSAALRLAMPSEPRRTATASEGPSTNSADVTVAAPGAASTSVSTIC
jgi:hypothetical protein